MNKQNEQKSMTSKTMLEKNGISNSTIMLAGAHLEGGRRGIHPLPSKGKLSLNRPFAPKIPHKGLK